MVKKLPKYFKSWQLKAILNAPHREDGGLEYRDWLIMQTLAKTGLRASELGNLKVRDIDFQAELITVREGKGGKDRVIPLHPQLSEWLHEWLSGSVDGYVFLSQQGNPISTRTLNNIVRKYAKRAGIPAELAHPHTFRHTFAVQCLKAGMNLRTVQKMLGHASLTTTQIYLDVTGEDIKEDFQAHLP